MEKDLAKLNIFNSIFKSALKRGYDSLESSLHVYPHRAGYLGSIYR